MPEITPTSGVPLGGTPSELVLTESRTMRAATIDRTDVLDKVKALALLPDGIHATTEIVASFCEVGIDAIESVVRRHRAELEENGLRKLQGADLREFKRAADGQTDSLPGNINSLRLFTRRTMLNVCQLLVESDVAKRVRTYLLDLEDAATPARRVEVMDRAEIDRARLARERLAAMGVAKQFGLANLSYLEAMARHELARMNGAEPDIDPADLTITCDEYLADQGVQAGDLGSARTRLGRTVAALYRARHGRDPQKIKRPIHGVFRDVAVYTRRDLDLFDTAWAELGRHYDVQTSIEGAAR